MTAKTRSEPQERQWPDPQELAAALDQLKPKKMGPRPSASALIRQIADHIEEAQRKGYTIKEILEVLSEKGFTTTDGTLRLAMSQVRRRRREEEKKRKKAAGSVSEARGADL